MRGVLLAAAACAALHGAGARARALCPGTTGAAAQDTLQMASQSPLYRLAKTRLGAATACQVRKDGDQETLVMSFPRGGALTLESSPAIEVATQSLTLGSAVPALTRAQALDTLQKTETALVGQKGCGIPWQRQRHAALAGHGDVSLTGRVCNCKATLLGKYGAVTGLEFSSAC
jgi:hypothetical protein